MFNFDPATGSMYGNKKKHQRLGGSLARVKPGASAKARSMMNLHNNEAGRRVSSNTFFLSFIEIEAVPIFKFLLLILWKY